ncbi:cytochrome c oxidase subunit II [Ottowia testudinis]|uniref:Cytochrome c oxidase subunit 2 n=1 Tax=Ottowia testudinis TaxID=2816950 RepID=A0A975H293_9BURK|nr:cytochrome c oxidase subunit II [Ottowia testudinis]QTD44628.1 cytochrome c oxidase subunit II [Ottowia testudinis]
MKSIASKLAGAPAQAAIWGVAWWAGAASAQVNDLPGGPAVRQLNLPPPVTKIAEAQSWLHWMMLIICTIIFIAVFSVMFYSIWKHRKSQGAKSATFHESVAVEVAWTVVPFLIVIGMALPATKVVVAQKDTTNADLTIKATGYQWKWGYDYLNGEGAGIGFLSTLDSSQRAMSNEGKPAGDDYLLRVDNPLVVPVGKKVRIITTANDVIHAWMVPAFGVKQDAIPGFVRDTWFRAEQTGDFYGQCAELCGKEHAYMPIHVKVLPQQEYTAWVAEKQKRMAALADDPNKVWTLPELVARGEKVYAANCAACHLESGKGGGAIKALDGSPLVLGAPADAMHRVLEGFNNGAMPSWKQLSDVELAAVVTYIKNHWTNKTGTMVQPAQFKAARAGEFPAGGATASAAPAAAPVAAPAAMPAPSAAAPATGMPFQVFFATGQSTIDAQANATLKAAVDYLKAHPEVKVALSGFVDSTGNADANAALAKKRAQAVRDALQAGGITADRIDLRKPEVITAAQGADREARRVDIAAAG